MTEIEQVHSGVRYENSNNTALQELQNEDDWEGGNNSAKLFERSRIKALAGQSRFYIILLQGSRNPLKRHRD